MAVTRTVLQKGLEALGEAYRQKVDANTVGLWGNVLRDLSDAQFRHAVGVQLRTTDRFMPAPGVVLAYGYDMPREVDTRPMPRLALPPADLESEGKLLCAVRENPISDLEKNGGIHGALHYIRRLAIAAELIDQDGNAVKVMR